MQQISLAEELTHQCSYRQGRFWDVEDLKESLSVANHEQMRPIVEKLKRGEPIKVLAIGDSITVNGECLVSWSCHMIASQKCPRSVLLCYYAISGGCFQRDVEHMSQNVNSLASTCTLDPERRGWLTFFMETINATYPHSDHILINLGSGGKEWIVHAHEEV